MNAKLLINRNGGNGKILNKVEKIFHILMSKFNNVDVKITEKEEDFVLECEDAAQKYDVLIFAGGDGTFHLVLNALKNVKNPPILGVIPSGTLCDAAKNFGVSKNLKKALKIILDGNVKEFDVGSINERYFAFSSSFGTYSDIPYSVSEKQKRLFGHFSYYFKAIPQLFKKRKYQFNLTLKNGEKMHIETPFLLVMNSKFMAGFNINKNSNINDGLIDVFYSKCEVFNGLWSYFFHKSSVNHLQIDHLEVECLNDGFWDIDGEVFKDKNVTFNVIPKRFKMFYKNKNN